MSGFGKLVLVAAGLLLAMTSAAQTTVLRAAGMIDVENGAVIRNAVVHVEQGRIIAAGAADKVTLPARAEEIDLGDRRHADNDGPYEMRKATRYQIRAGAQCIKVAISSGIAAPVGGIGQPLMTRDEIAAVVHIANRHGVKVTAHSGSAEATKVAVEEGLHGIEHGYYLDREVLQMMAERGVWYTPTIVVSQPATFDFYQRIGSPPWYLERVNEVGKAHWRALETAIEEGVNIALGSDQHPHEPNDGTTATIREAEYYVQAGMTPLQALQSATIQCARMLEITDDIGTIAPGKYADIVAVSGNPLEDFGHMRRLSFVMKGGVVYPND